MVHEASWNTLRLACKTLLKTLFSTASLLKVWWNSSVALPKNKGNSPPLVRNFGNFYLNTFPSSSYSFQSFFSPFHQMSCYRLEAAAGPSLLPLSSEALVLLKAPEPLPGSAWWLPHQPGHSLPWENFCLFSSFWALNTTEANSPREAFFSGSSMTEP